MKPAEILRVTSDLLLIPDKHQLIDVSGDFIVPTAQRWSSIASDVEAVLKARNVHTPDRLDAVLKLLPLVLQLVGAK